MNRRNYQKELDELLASFSEKKRLFLHCCCAPCSSYVLEYLHDFFDITVFFYNPNISEACEYQKRKEELKRFLQTAPFGKEIHMHDADYEPELFEKRQPQKSCRYKSYSLDSSILLLYPFFFLKSDGR